MVNNAWQKIIRSFLAYPRSDRNGIIVLGTILCLVITSNIILKHSNPKSSNNFAEIKAILDQWEEEQLAIESKTVFFSFNPNTISKEMLDSLSIPQFVKQNMLNYRKAGGIYKTAADVRKIYGMNDSIFVLIENYIVTPKAIKEKVVSKSKPKVISKLSGFFNPNNTSANELSKFGFNKFQSQNVLKYVANGGSFITPADLLKIYGIDSAFYLKIEEHIKIDENVIQPEVHSSELILVELNSADSMALKSLHGIGSTFSKRIIKYRNLLGGFYQKEQLLEIYNFPEEIFRSIQHNVSVDSLKLTKIRINFTDYSELIKHPYLGKSEVKAILKQRDTGGAFKNISEVKRIKGLNSETFNKIRPYITCR